MCRLPLSESSPIPHLLPSKKALSFYLPLPEQTSLTSHAHTEALPGYHSQDDVNQTTFPLPNLGSRLVEASKTIHEGRGFVVMRGLEPTKYSSLDNMLLYLGVTSYIAEKRGMQDYDGRMVRTCSRAPILLSSLVG